VSYGDADPADKARAVLSRDVNAPAAGSPSIGRRPVVREVIALLALLVLLVLVTKL
jgi:hypothetical protein